MLILAKSGILVFVFVLQTAHAGQQCLSCSGVEDADECHHHVTCNDNEVCIMHHFISESGSISIDLGCASTQACPQWSSFPAFGKRAEGHHTSCSMCCNDTLLCNQHLDCYTTSQPPTHNLPRECSDVKQINPNSKSGVFTIYPFSYSQKAVSVYCVFESNGQAWTVIQRRYNGSVDFYRNWQSYKDGFGSAYGEYWLGNDVIHELTSHANHDLRVNMTDFEGASKYAEYTLFSIGDEENAYRLTVYNYSGDAGDCLSSYSGMRFTTYDNDNDIAGGNCAVAYKGAWWYKSCHCANLNGQYLSGTHDTDADGVNWGLFRGQHYSLKSVIIMIRKY